MTRPAEPFDLQANMQRWRDAADRALVQALDEIAARPGCPRRLSEAMRYAVLGGGKRLRPALCMAAAQACGGSEDQALDGAVAVEFIHAYSLVHDDLPAMDDDDFRRGRPTCHKRHGEAMAILAGDALLTHGFEFAARIRPADEALRILTAAAGAAGMVGGQADDVDGRAQEIEEVESAHRRKTACMMQAAVGLGALAAGGPPSKRRALDAYAQNLGLAFQIADDLLAAQGAAAELGRPTGSDQAQARRTYTALAGLDGARRRTSQLLDQARRDLSDFGPEADGLRALIDWLERRGGLPALQDG